MNLPFTSKQVAWFRGYEAANNGEDVKYSISDKSLPDSSWRTTLRHRGLVVLGAIGSALVVVVVVLVAMKKAHHTGNQQLWHTGLFYLMTLRCLGGAKPVYSSCNGAGYVPTKLQVLEFV